MISAEETPVAYGGGVIRLETELLTLEVADIRSRMNISIMDLGQMDMLIGYDWLDAHNPAIDWQKEDYSQPRTCAQGCWSTTRDTPDKPELTPGREVWQDLTA
ncbi:hypothetical protein KJE20_14248 [Pyrenophora tritici-repentis]|nr:hypothetical protein KJE20_14248 [Pyrenophora tritici-repentis]